MVLSRIIRVSKGEERSPVPARWITRIFVIGDVVAILGQATGEFSKLLFYLRGVARRNPLPDIILNDLLEIKHIPPETR
ncbi:hypothetical protein AtubIFM57258_000457 [Aspergillus tubingensis]|nr:hypothetical protein AtubIFM57258_000457 [Aspergillus tubingensis]